MAKLQFKVSKKLILSITYTSPTYYIHIENIFMRRYDKLFNKFLYVNIINVLCSTSLPAETRLTVYRRLAVRDRLQLVGFWGRERLSIFLTLKCYYMKEFE